MYNESHPSPTYRGEEEYGEQDRLRWQQREIRIATKDIFMVAEQLPERFPNRDKVLQLAEQLLILVPVYDQADEDFDSRERQHRAENIQRIAREHAENGKKP
jgi:hypothetical protein